MRRWRPLHLYAALEVAVAFFGCTIVFALPLLGVWLRPVWQALWIHHSVLLGLRFVLSFLILLVPTTAMGLTLPVLMEDPVLRRTNFGRAIGLLYGCNTLGAVGGAVLGEAYLIEAFGLRGTGLIAGLASCIAATAALLVARSDAATGSIISDTRSTGLALPLALPSASFGRDGQLWVASEEANSAGGRQVVLARSTNEGVTWSKLAPIPGTTSGTAIFSWVAAGGPHHVGVLYYYTADNGNPGALTNSTWSAMWAESFNADSPVPTWTVTTAEPAIHIGAICIAADCSGSNRFAGDFISAIIGPNEVSHLTWMKQEGGTGAISIRYQQIQSSPPSKKQPRKK